ncbi:hypothetical protein C7C46_15470 [Streptomyces tateyamensis]|uniref:Peptidase C51 domain-containing protein n=1 Tax=Streptomyces tateyamensis TaxID=565073 RepID=A0A2V4NEM3_9ACTN|nr:CHAP domain-containing protein [Streptomyces tateyamensis]PYC78695.1 hypothetical protein C7C46_15470 [Streptomyces tateyamensis]
MPRNPFVRTATLTAALAVASSSMLALATTPASAAASRSAIVSAAHSQLGHSCSSAYDGMDCSLNWCAAFATWAWGQGGVDVSKLGWTVTTFVNYGDNNGTWHDPGTYTPQPGDAMIFGGSGFPTKASGGAHIGLVESVGSNGTVTEIGGNQGGLVTEHTGTADQIEHAVEGSAYNFLGYVSPVGASGIPAGFNVTLAGVGAGQSVSGTLNLRANASQSGVIEWLDYVITGPNGYRNEVRAGSGASGYPYALDTTALANGGYSISMTAHEIDGANHTYAGTNVTVANQSAIVSGERVYGLAPDKSAVSVYNGSGTGPGAWTQIGGVATDLYASDAGLFATNPDDGSISRYNGSGAGPGAWTVVGGAGAQFATGGGHLYGLAPDRSSVSVWNGTPNSWTQIGGAATAIYASDAGLFATNPDDGSISRYNGSGAGPGAWTVVGGAGAQFATGGGHLYGLAPDRSSVSVWNGTPNSWTQIGGAATTLYAGGDGLLAVNPNDGSVSRYNGTPGDWTPIGGAASAFAVGAGHVVGLSVDGSAVSVWNGSGTGPGAWTVIGSGASEVVIGS